MENENVLKNSRMEKGEEMANIIDYLNWRGDLPFSAAPLNTVDIMIFCQISYYNLEGVVPEDLSEEPVTIRQACSKPVLSPLPNYCFEEDIELCRLIPDCVRFADLKMKGFVNKIDPEQKMQFCAVTYDLGEDGTLVAFRGTDNTLVGWRENLDLAYNDAVPSQLQAVSYLENAAAVRSGPIRICGHSKGGNLAVYSAAFCEPETRERIKEVYNFDGPGFNLEVIRKEEFQNIFERVKTFVPQDSIIGLLLEHKEPCSYIHSTGSNGITQHCVHSWAVTRDDLVRENSLTKSGENYRENIAEWINAMTYEEKKAFVEILFNLVSEYRTTEELFTLGNLWKVMKAYGEMDKEKKNVVSGVLDELRKTVFDNVKEKIGYSSRQVKDFFLGD